MIKIQFAFSLKEIKCLTDANVLEYTYNSDKLNSFDGNLCEYDALGNPTLYRNKSLEWNTLRNLAKYDTIDFTYNANGIRTKKVNGNPESKFYYLDNRLLSEKRDIHSSDLNVNDYLYEGEIYYTYTDKTDISYMYHANELTSFTITKQGQNETYYYSKNLQGDITHIYDITGTLKAEYTYDAWGNHEILTNVDNIANINPFRYRGYYYDTETGLYYLQSRYYDPETGRFINADVISILDESKNLINGLNLFAYCGNNPVMNIDPSGEAWWKWLLGALGAIAIVALSIMTAGAIIAALPAIANLGMAIMGSIGLASLGGAVATGISIAGAALAVGTLVIGVNEAISFATGFNPISSLIGEKAYSVVSGTIGIASYATIMMGSMLPYPSTGDGNADLQNIKQKMSINNAIHNPKSGTVLMMKEPMSDARMPSWLGWQKYQLITRSSYTGNTTIHYIGNKYLLSWFGIWFDFKFTKR